MKNLVIFGTGGVGRETSLIVDDINSINREWNLIGFIDDKKDLQGKIINGYQVLGDREYLNEFDKEIYVVIAIANHYVKEELVKYFTNKNIKYATLVHPSVHLNDSIKMGEGCIVYPNVIMTVDITIGNHVIISPKCGIGHDCVIEDFVTLLWNVNVSGAEIIRQGATLGSGCTIIQGLEIGKNSYVGAGTVVIRDIEENKTAVGVPSRYIGENYEKDLICNNSEQNNKRIS